MIGFLTAIHVINCLLLMVVVLLQSSKGGGLAGAFGGGGGSQAVFGGRGAGSFLSRATTVLAIIFMLTSLTLTVLNRRGVAADSAMKRALEAEQRRGVPTPGLPVPGSGRPEGDQAATPGADAGGVAPAAPATGGGDAPAAPATGGGDGGEPATGGATTP